MTRQRMGIEAWLPDGVPQDLFAVDRTDVPRLDLHDNEAVAAECERQLREVHAKLECDISEAYFGLDRTPMELPALAVARLSLMRRAANRIAEVLRSVASRLDGYPAYWEDE